MFGGGVGQQLGQSGCKVGITAASAQRVLQDRSSGYGRTAAGIAGRRQVLKGRRTATVAVAAGSDAEIVVAAAAAAAVVGGGGGGGAAAVAAVVAAAAGTAGGRRGCSSRLFGQLDHFGWIRLTLTAAHLGELQQNVLQRQRQQHIRHRFRRPQRKKKKYFEAHAGCFRSYGGCV